MSFRPISRVVSLISGGGSGLGRGTAERFVSKGGKVVILDLPSSPGAEVANSLGAESCLFVPADVTNEKQVEDAVSATKEKFGSLDCVVNCAGIAIARKIYHMRMDRPHEYNDFMKILEVNVGGTFNVMRLALKEMLKNEPVDNQRGVIINTASVAAFDGQQGQVAYSASKAAVAGMALPIARDLQSNGIRVMTIAPGLFTTPMLEKLPEHVIAELGNQTPFPKRFGLPEEYGMLAQHIVENPMLNGEVIRLDGALRMM